MKLHFLSILFVTFSLYLEQFWIIQSFLFWASNIQGCNHSLAGRTSLCWYPFVLLLLPSSISISPSCYKLLVSCAKLQYSCTRSLRGDWLPRCIVTWTPLRVFLTISTSLYTRYKGTNTSQMENMSDGNSFCTLFNRVAPLSVYDY